MENKFTWNKESASRILDKFITQAPKILSDGGLGRSYLIRNTFLTYFLTFEKSDDTPEQATNITVQAFSVINLLLEQNNQPKIKRAEIKSLAENIK